MAEPEPWSEDLTEVYVSRNGEWVLLDMLTPEEQIEVRREMNR